MGYTHYWYRMPKMDMEPFGLAVADCRPYDLAVQCCLIVFKQHFGAEFQVMSNGDTADWDDAREWCDETLGYGMDFELKDDDE